MSDTPHVGLLSDEQLAELRLVVDEERTGHDGTPFAKLGFWPSKVDALLQQLAAAEAHATEAAAEAGKLRGLLVKAETEVAGLRDRLAQEQRVTSQQEGQMLALVQETHRWSAAEKRDKARHQEEVDALKGELALLKPMLNACDSLRREGVALLVGRPAAPAPVAPPQRKEVARG